MGKLKIEEHSEMIRNSFPFQYSKNTTLFLINDSVEFIKASGKEGNKYIIHLVDNEGYKYRVDYHHLKSSHKIYKNPNRFFMNNPYTYENINTFCRNNNIDLKIDGSNLPVKGYAREKLNFYNSNGEIIKVSWNEISTNTFRYQRGYEDKKKQKHDDKLMTKEKAIPLILEKYNELQRPLVQRDFMNSNSLIGIHPIRDIWGTFTEMLRDLNLPEHDTYHKPFDKNYRPHEEIMESIKTVCETVKSQGRNTVLYTDFKEIADISEVSTIRRHCELDGTTLRDVVKSYGCELQQAGNGMNHRFEDGEYTTSKYEYDFSQFLRDNGFEYGKTYFRNIYYKKIDNEYNGNMNCDYCIDFNGQLVYIELAGILGNREHQDAYRNNTPLKSKSKEEYRQKLNQKRKMFERNNLEYYILLKDEMNENTYKNILNKYLKEVA